MKSDELRSGCDGSCQHNHDTVKKLEWVLREMDGLGGRVGLDLFCGHDPCVLACSHVTWVRNSLDVMTTWRTKAWDNLLPKGIWAFT